METESEAREVPEASIETAGAMSYNLLEDCFLHLQDESSLACLQNLAFIQSKSRSREVICTRVEESTKLSLGRSIEMKVHTPLGHED